MRRSNGLSAPGHMRFPGGTVGWNAQQRFETDNFTARADGMIVSSGCTIAGTVFEAALLPHEAVMERAVTGQPDPDGGQIVKAIVVTAPDGEPGKKAIATGLQAHVKATIAFNKYSGVVEFVAALPKTGKIQRFRLGDAWSSLRR